MQGAVIYGARSFSVHAGNSNTHGRTEGLKGKDVHFPFTAFTLLVFFLLNIFSVKSMCNVYTWKQQMEDCF